jgi:hypothetical protein
MRHLFSLLAVTTFERARPLSVQKFLSKGITFLVREDLIAKGITLPFWCKGFSVPSAIFKISQVRSFP